MKIISQSYEILTPISMGGVRELKQIEDAARTCYKSTGTDEPNENFIRNLISNGHEAMLEHSTLSVKFITDRAIANELVRHRMCSFAQESTRYCNYSKDRFNGEITFIRPTLPSNLCLSECMNFEQRFREACKEAEAKYLDILDVTKSPQVARAVLPLCTKTEIVCTTNYREWRHIFKLRCDANAHPDMQGLMRPLLKELRTSLPVIFDDIDVFDWE